MSRTRNRNGFTLVEVMVTTSVMVIGLLAVASATTTTSLMRKRGVEEAKVFAAAVGRLEWARGELFADTAFHDAVQASLAGGASHVQGFLLDDDGDGVQDLSSAPSDNATPVLQVTVTAPDPPGDPSLLLQVVVTANWYGVSGQRTRSVSALVSNRTGYSE